MADYNGPYLVIKMLSNLKIFIISLCLFTGYKTYAAGTDTLSVHFEKGSAVLPEAEKTKFRDILVFKDSIIAMTITGWADEKPAKCRSRRLAKQRAKAVKTYLSEQGLAENKITVERLDTSQGVRLAACRYGEVIVVFTYNTLIKVQSEH